ncbi:MAG: hypothetical protein KME15_14095 [Drouetiella hepatica Uher 2000/2452]|jgi:hypothetical protein|uniref:Uncharacterized protein n=1 Tax=Drouetiella hepatica Uher 2000/2452 TaxID=904376 RepID=A0A951QBL5_9CYAN|nr:hypothetical protein [Drouetiella hepatica Uher 2000/2452]
MQLQTGNATLFTPMMQFRTRNISLETEILLFQTKTLLFQVTLMERAIAIFVFEGRSLTLSL